MERGLRKIRANEDIIMQNWEKKIKDDQFTAYEQKSPVSEYWRTSEIIEKQVEIRIAMLVRQGLKWSGECINICRLGNSKTIFCRMMDLGLLKKLFKIWYASDIVHFDPNDLILLDSHGAKPEGKKIGSDDKYSFDSFKYTLYPERGRFCLKDLEYQ